MPGLEKNTQKFPNRQEKLKKAAEEEIHGLYSKAYNAKSFLYLKSQ